MSQSKGFMLAKRWLYARPPVKSINRPYKETTVDPKYTVRSFRNSRSDIHVCIKKIDGSCPHGLLRKQCECTQYRCYFGDSYVFFWDCIKIYSTQ